MTTLERELKFFDQYADRLMLTDEGRDPEIAVKYPLSQVDMVDLPRLIQELPPTEAVNCAAELRIRVMLLQKKL